MKGIDHLTSGRAGATRWVGATAAVAASILLACVGAGCGGTSKAASKDSASSSSPASTESTSTHASATIDFVDPNISNAFFVAMQNGAKAEAKKLGVTVNIDGTEGDVQPPETSELHSLLASKPSGLVVAPAVPAGAVPALQQWQHAKIPLATMNNSLPNTVTTVGAITTNNVEMGEQGAEALAHDIGGKGDVAIIDLTRDPSDNARLAGFKKEIAKFPNVHIVALEFTNNGASASIPESQAESLISKYPDLKGFWGNYDVATESIALGVKQTGNTGKIAVAGVDGDPTMFSLVKSGEIQVLVQQQTAKMGALALQQVVKNIRTGKTFKPTALPTVVVTPSNVDAMAKYAY